MKNPDQLRKYGESLRARITVALGLATIAWLSTFGEVQAQEPVGGLSRPRMEWMTEEGSGTHNISREDSGLRENRMALAGDYASLETKNIESGNRNPEDDGTEFVNNTLKIILKPILCIITLLGLPTLTYALSERKAKNDEHNVAKRNVKSGNGGRRGASRDVEAHYLTALKGGKPNDQIAETSDVGLAINSNRKKGREESFSDSPNEFAVTRRVVEGMCKRSKQGKEQYGQHNLEFCVGGNCMKPILNNNDVVTLYAGQYIEVRKNYAPLIGDLVLIDFTMYRSQGTSHAIGIYAGDHRGRPILLSLHDTRFEERYGHGQITRLPYRFNEIKKITVMGTVSSNLKEAKLIVSALEDEIRRYGRFVEGEER